MLASSQGDSIFVAFSRKGDNAYFGSFAVGENGAIDGVQESDGAMVVNMPLGAGYPEGLMVVHDGLNDPAVMVEDEGQMENANTNFKFLSWADVANAFDPPLQIDPAGFNPRS